MSWLIIGAFTFIILIGLGKKWEIKLKIVIPWASSMVILEYIMLHFLNENLPNISMPIQLLIGFSQSIFLTAGVILFFFFRDPDRSPPSQKRIILSPADGKILYIRVIKKGCLPLAVKGRKEIPLKEFTQDEFITNGGFQIGIGMNLLNVHVNRSPIQGKVVRIRRIPGRFSSLKKIDSLLENERVFTVIEGEEIKVGIVQIASRLVRRIISYINEGENVKMGQKLGMIRFGSQVDLLIPLEKGIKITVKEKENVKAGISIIGNLVG